MIPRSEIHLPYFIGESAEGKSAVIELPGINLSEASLLELQVISGGPVFLFKRATNAADAYAATHGVNGQVDFDCAAALGQKAEVLVRDNIGTITLSSDEVSVGFVRLISLCR